MPEARSPFYVSFIHDQIPRKIDHSSSHPGPPGGSANRVGYTSVRSRARLTVAWDNLPTGSDGRLLIFALSVNVYFRLTDFLIAVSSDFATRSCAYRVTLRHELEAHIHDPIRIFHSYRDLLIRRLNPIVVPTRQAPLRVASTDEAESRKDEVARPIILAIGRTRRELVQELRQARDHHDSPDSYRLVHNQCTDTQWSSGR